MFYEIFDTLCKENGTSPSAVCVKLGMSKTVASFWKKSGGIPKHETLEKIAAYFGVSVDYLLGKEETQQHKIQGGIRPDEIIAIKGTTAQWLELLNGMTDEQLDELQNYAEYLIEKGKK